MSLWYNVQFLCFFFFKISSTMMGSATLRNSHTHAHICGYMFIVHSSLWNATSDTFFDSFLFPWTRHVLWLATTSLTAPGQPPFRTVPRAVFRIVTAVEKTRATKSHISFFLFLDTKPAHLSNVETTERFSRPVLVPDSLFWLWSLTCQREFFSSSIELAFQQNARLL